MLDSKRHFSFMFLARWLLPATIGITAVVVPAVGAMAQNASQDAGVIASAQLPRDLSPWGMFVSADIVVQSVMVGLVLASVATWTVWLAKMIELLVVRRQVVASLNTISTARTLAEASARHGGAGGAIAQFLDAALLELRQSSDITDKDGIKERVASRLERIEAAHGRRIARGTNVLATIGAIAPFVGLFGTVWGIMNSFIGISKSHTTSLAVVAPGIAEALLATAFGLVAAIPAVVIYNLFARMIAGYRALLAEASAEVLRLVSRDLDRQGQATSPRTSSLSAAAE